MSERITAEQVQSDVESYALRASPDGRRRVIREALDKARREGGEDAEAEVARLREALAASEARAATSADTLTTIALAAGLGADAIAAEVAARVGEMARTLSLIGTWRHEHGAALKPSRSDTYGDGMRAAKGQVGAILSRLAKDAGRG